MVEKKGEGNKERDAGEDDERPGIEAEAEDRQAELGEAGADVKRDLSEGDKAAKKAAESGVRSVVRQLEHKSDGLPKDAERRGVPALQQARRRLFVRENLNAQSAEQDAAEGKDHKGV